jgi:hypothetical protein
MQKKMDTSTSTLTKQEQQAIWDSLPKDMNIWHKLQKFADECEQRRKNAF